VIRASEEATPRLSYERRGRGEPLLLIHGAGSYRRMWETVMDILAAKRKVIAVDLPGHGDSLLMEERIPPKSQNFARLMVAFLQELEMESAHVAGNSSGGWTALEMAKLGHSRSVTIVAGATLGMLLL
jgi:pimeloyl-ACP methyl ester carboxylesterase